MKSKHVLFIMDNIGVEEADMFEFILKAGLVEELQDALNKNGSELAIDGLIGINTLLAIVNNKEKLDRIFKEVLFSKPKVIDYEKRARKDMEVFVSHYESDRVHYLIKEKGFTAPYGIYSIANPNSKPIRYIEQLYNSYGLNKNYRQHAAKLDSMLTKEERAKACELAMELYLDKYLNGLMPYLKMMPKTLLSYFSNSINGGVSTGNKSLQYALGIKVDGVFGKNSRKRLKEVTSKDVDKSLSQLTLKYMSAKYCRLITNNPDKYLINKNGWLNRIKYLGFKGNRLC